MSLEKRKIDDAGVKIGGARKDQWAARGLNIDDLSLMSAEEAFQYVSKDAVWPAPDYSSLVETGMPADVAAMVKIVRDRMSAKPKPGKTPEEASANRAAYVRMVGHVRDFCLGVKSLDEFRNSNTRICEIGGIDRSRLRDYRSEDSRIYFSVYKGRVCPFTLDYKDRRRISEMVEEGFPAKTNPWMKGVKIIKGDGDGLFFVARGRMIERDGFQDIVAAEQWLKSEYENNLQKKLGVSKINPARPHLDHFERVGMPDWRRGRSVTPDDFIRVFGFRGVEFGNYVPDDERQRVLDMGYDALQDLADVMEIPASSIGLDGRLGIAFGARGSGGANATYDPTYKAINMTRLRGGGSVAHEYFHALDQYAGDVDRLQTTGRIHSGSGWHDWTESRRGDLPNLSYNEAAAWEAFMSSIRNTPRTKEEAIASVEAGLESLKEKIAKYREALQNHVNTRDAGARDRKWMKDVDQWIESSSLRVKVTLEKIDEMASRSPDGDFGFKSSSYMEEAKKIGGPTGQYWVRPNEMAARAFECAIFDRLRSAGKSSPYLVNGVEEARFAGEDFKGNPYPVGAERAMIGAKAFELVSALRPRLEMCSVGLSSQPSAA